MQLIDRTIEILLILSHEPDGLAITELANRLDISNSSTHRILQSLKKHHFVLQSTETKRYRLGYKVLTLTTNISKENNFTFAAKPFMKELSDKVGETVALCVLEGENIVCLDFVESQNSSKFMVNPGIAMPPHATSAGKAILAYRTLGEIRNIYNSYQDNRLTSNTLVEWNSFIAELELTKTRGYAISDEELQIGVQGAACPIFDFNHNVIGSVSITALKNDNKLTEENIQFLSECAQAITNSIGGTPNGINGKKPIED